eukprot:CAMPEP_0202910978 /NCGR_PEP_ID=MMETSP1392-20130828/53600_1 /ASSEMBLY_ACC=CAM_ASM_000868 /TAXON_ID=225041 /ORGANISM="Chlamydomonas chlamydogama, Strain SAG 11-48b" /LENGTH=107 /DNA_ID=CAMNT_0049601305 /DNA_START=989 /DNA_END=1309 /DNA_ORIENTATION=+
MNCHKDADTHKLHPQGSCLAWGPGWPSVWFCMCCPGLQGSSGSRCPGYTTPLCMRNDPLCGGPEVLQQPWPHHGQMALKRDKYRPPLPSVPSLHDGTERDRYRCPAL